jgi:exosortase/archaeosortase family protein
MCVCDGSRGATLRFRQSAVRAQRPSLLLAAALSTLASSSASAFGLGDPAAGGGGGGPISGIAAALPHTDGVIASLVGAGVLLGILWRHRRGGLWLAAAAAVLMATLSPWAALSVWLTVFAGLRASQRVQLAPAVTTSLAVGVTSAVGAAAVAPALARVVQVLLEIVVVTPVEVRGSVLTGPTGFVHVATACVGLEGVVVAFALSSAVALFAGARQRVALLAGAAAAGAWSGLNVVRIAAIFVLVQHDVETAELAHDAAGLVLMVAHVLLCGLTWFAVRSVGAWLHQWVPSLRMRAHRGLVIWRQTASPTNESSVAGNTPPGLRMRPRNA